MSDAGATINPQGASSDAQGRAAPAVPPVPRPITRRARLRSWAEMPVRIWLILMLVVAAVTLLFTVSRVREAMDDRWLIQHGTDVIARLGKTGGNMVPKRQLRTEPLPSSLIFTLNGKQYQFDVTLEPRTGKYAQQGMDFPIKVDPADPEGRWTEETVPKPWSQELTVAVILAPLVLVLAAVMLIRRRGVLKTWRDGELAEAQVVETRHCAPAPLSRIVRFTLARGPDRRIHSTLLPVSSGIPAPGETIWIIAPSNHPARAIVAELYV